MSDEYNFFLPITKIDEAKRTVSGYASTPAKDGDGEIITLDAVKKALPAYMAWANIREMHKLSAVGVADEAHIDKMGLFVTARIVDDGAWDKCKTGVYKGFSIGGKKLSKSGNKVTGIDMTEISIVDRPCNHECSFALAKRLKDVKPDTNVGGYLLKAADLSPEAKALKKMAGIVKDLAKAGPPAAHDGFSLPAKGGKEISPLDANPHQVRKTDDDTVPCEAHGKVGCKKCAIVKRMSIPCEAHNKVGCDKCALTKGGDAPGNGSKPYGDVEYADPGHQDDKKARYPIDTEDHIRAAWNYIHKKKNAKKYSSANLASVKSKIVSAWKSKIHKDGPPAVADEAKKAIEVEDLTKAISAYNLGEGGSFLTLGKAESAETTAPGGQEALPFLELKKGMSSVGSLAYVFDSLRGAQRSLLAEGQREGGDKKDHALADKLGQLAQGVSEVMALKSKHEGSEATDLSDADDNWVRQLLGAKNMDTTTLNLAEGGDPLAQYVIDVMKRAAEPSKAERMKDADENVKKARGAAKEACKAIKAAHDMHKAAYLSKMAKAAKGEKKNDDDEGFDHQGAMEKLQKAYAEMDKVRMFGKAARGQLEKAMAGRKGQNGQEAGDAEGGFYEVPVGVRDLSPAMLATASPGGKGKGSQPIVMNADGSTIQRAEGLGDLAKFVKNGQVPVEIMQMAIEKAALEREVAMFKAMPAGGGARPRSFNPNAFQAGNTPFGGKGADRGDLRKTLFEGVDVSRINGEDEGSHRRELGKAIGNLLLNPDQFGRSIMDADFKGMAGVAAA